MGRGMGDRAARYTPARAIGVGGAFQGIVGLESLRQPPILVIGEGQAQGAVNRSTCAQLLTLFGLVPAPSQRFAFYLFFRRLLNTVFC